VLSRRENCQLLLYFARSHAHTHPRVVLLLLPITPVLCPHLSSSSRLTRHFLFHPHMPNCERTVSRDRTPTRSERINERNTSSCLSHPQKTKMLLYRRSILTRIPSLVLYIICIPAGPSITSFFFSQPYHVVSLNLLRTSFSLSFCLFQKTISPFSLLSPASFLFNPFFYGAQLCMSYWMLLLLFVVDYPFSLFRYNVVVVTTCSVTSTTVCLCFLIYLIDLHNLELRNWGCNY